MKEGVYHIPSIQQITTDAGYSIKELAELIGETHWKVCEWAKGTRKPPEEMIQKMSDVLGCTPKRLMLPGPAKKLYNFGDYSILHKEGEECAKCGKIATNIVFKRNDWTKTWTMCRNTRCSLYQLLKVLETRKGQKDSWTWLPIKTAPKDRPILVFDGKRQHVATYAVNIQSGENAFKICNITVGDEVYNAITNPIYWMELPKLPKKEQEIQ